MSGVKDATVSIETYTPTPAPTPTKGADRKSILAFAIITSSLLIVALLSLILCFTVSPFMSAGEIVLTFWVSFLIGLGGAGVYLSLFLMTEKHLKILQNSIISDLGLMTFIFLLSGGFVAAVTQVSTGILVSSGAQAVFMVGFGWLGALSGVAGIGERAKLNLDNLALTTQKNVAEDERKSADALKEENKELKGVIDVLEERLKEHEKKLKGRE